MTMATLFSSRTLKSITAGSLDGIQLPMFTVLTGPNGSGKTNLLEALQQNASAFTELGELQQPDVRLFRLGDLLVVADGPTTGESFKEPWANLFNYLQQLKSSVNSQPGLDTLDARADWVDQQVIANSMVTRGAIERMKLELPGTRLMNITANQLRDHAPLIGGIRDPFTTSLSEIFLTYSQRRIANDFSRWRQEQTGRGEVISSEEFEQRFGEAPWLVLDRTLALLDLPYRFLEPPDDTDLVQYRTNLIDADGNEIAPSELSSGERTLLTIAVSLFTGSSPLSEAVRLPRLLLLDEADASLHPSMVKSLLTVIEEIFVQQYNVRVILTTHSPSTVALAPPDALYVMSRKAPRIQHVSVDRALRLLTVGMTTLSVQLENRRQIFVESEYDQAIYQDLFRVARPYIMSERTAEFIAAGKKDNGGGCESVKRLVRDLRAAGIDTVSGIIDRDKRGGAPGNIHYLGDRYSIENVLFDPLILGTFLLRSRVLSATNLGLPANTRHFELDGTHAQVMISSLQAKLNFGDETVPSEYVGNFVAQIPLEFLETQGHALEELVMDTFPQLKAYKTKLKSKLVSEAVADVPSFIPKSVVGLLQSIVEAD